MSFFKKIKSAVQVKSGKQSEKYNVGLDKANKNFSDKLNNLAAKFREVDKSYFEQIEEILIEADIKPSVSFEIVEELEKEVRISKLKKPSEINEALIDKIFVYYAQAGEDIDTSIKENKNGPTIILLVGVNGVGKTTSIAKLAYKYKKEKKKVLIVAGDTFRAGAIEQLNLWAKDVDVDFFSANQNDDPSSVFYKASQKAKKEKYDIVICDSAGRLQTKVNLMNELAKMRKVLSKQINGAPHEVVLVLDATTGQNGIEQAKKFTQATGVDSILLAKMDGTSKGGIILSIREELGVPVKYIGVGEKASDLSEFDLELYIHKLCQGVDGFE